MRFEGMSNEHLVAELMEKHGHVFMRGGREAEDLFFQLGLVYCRPNSPPECRDLYTKEITRLMPPDTAQRVLQREANRREPPAAIKVAGRVSRDCSAAERKQPWWQLFRI
jgi:hypothetical protein